MARRKNKSSTGTALVVVGAVILYAIASIPREVWFLLGFLVTGFLVIYVIYRVHRAMAARSAEREEIAARASAYKKEAQTQSDQRARVARLELDRATKLADRAQTRAQVVAAAKDAQVAERGGLAGSNPQAELGRVQAPAHHNSQIRSEPVTSVSSGLIASTRWIDPGERVTVAGVEIPGGMIYVGSKLEDVNGGVDPCLIDPRLPVVSRASFTERDMDYWPVYSAISPTARRAYLSWLADGRRHPEANIGYVFLFFYGLERRVIREHAQVSSDERGLIEAELRRLLGIYADVSHSFRRYATELLDWLALSQYSPRIYNDPIPEFPRTMELPLYVRLALGQTALERVPVPAPLALAWARLDPNISLRTPAVRCSGQFEQLFAQVYREAFGEGLQLPRNRSKLRFAYRPASGGFQGQTITLSFGDTPDVTALTAPIRKLQDVVEAATKALEPYSRFIGRNMEAAESLEALLHLPVSLWPERPRQGLGEFKERIGAGMISVSFLELQTALDSQAVLTREKTLVLAKALESMSIGMEPDILAGAKAPKPEDTIILFALPADDLASSSDPHYKAAALTLQLAASVAAADGDFSAGEIALLRRQVQSWAHLSEGHGKRLLAHLRLLSLAPMSLASLKRKLEPLDSSAKETLAVFMTTVAAADGSVSPKEIRLLESVYKALDIDAARVFSDVHAVVAHAEDQAARRAVAQADASAGQESADSPLEASADLPSVEEREAAAEIPRLSTSPVVARHADVPVFVETPASAPEQEWGIPARPDLAPFVQPAQHIPAFLRQVPVEPAPEKVPEAGRVASGLQLDPVRLAAARADGERISRLMGDAADDAAPQSPAVLPPVHLPSPVKAVASHAFRGQPEKPKFQLDHAKIAALRKDTDRVSALLAGIFQEDISPEPVSPAPEALGEGDPVDDVQTRLLGLDAAHTAFARMLLSRPQWSRDELTDLAADLDLMLDGALERINEASFDVHDVPFTEGDDPIDVNAELLEMIEA